MEMMIYAIVVALVVGDMVGYYFINKKRLAIDTSTEEGKARHNMLKTVLLLLHIHSFVIAAIVLFIVKPMLVH